MIGQPEPRCFRCKRTPREIAEYREAAAVEGTTPEQYVRAEEGTYNTENGHFACTSCYIAIGMPTAPGRGWKAP